MCKVVRSELDLMSKRMCKVALFIYILIFFKKLMKKKKTATWLMMWLNWSVATINTTFQLLDIYKYKLVATSRDARKYLIIL